MTKRKALFSALSLFLAACVMLVSAPFMVSADVFGPDSYIFGGSAQTGLTLDGAMTNVKTNSNGWYSVNCHGDGALPAEIDSSSNAQPQLHSGSNVSPDMHNIGAINSTPTWDVIFKFDKPVSGFGFDIYIGNDLTQARTMTVTAAGSVSALGSGTVVANSEALIDNPPTLTHTKGYRFVNSEALPAGTHAVKFSISFAGINIPTDYNLHLNQAKFILPAPANGIGLPQNVKYDEFRLAFDNITLPIYKFGTLSNGLSNLAYLSGGTAVYEGEGYYYSTHGNATPWNTVFNPMNPLKDFSFDIFTWAAGDSLSDVKAYVAETEAGLAAATEIAISYTAVPCLSQNPGRRYAPVDPSAIPANSRFLKIVITHTACDTYNLVMANVRYGYESADYDFGTYTGPNIDSLTYDQTNMDTLYLENFGPGAGNTLVDKVGASTMYATFAVPSAYWDKVFNAAFYMTYGEAYGPVTLEISSDGTHFTPVEVASSKYTGASPWSLMIHTIKAPDAGMIGTRYIRFTATKPTTLKDHLIALHAVKFSDTAIPVPGGSVKMAVAGARDVSVCLDIGSNTTAQALSILTLSASAAENGTYTDVNCALTATEFPGVYTLENTAALPSGTNFLKVTLADDNTLASKIVLFRADMIYARPFAITADYNSGQGSIAVSNEAAYGDTVNFTVTPNALFTINSVTVTAASGADIPLSGNSFVMPYEAVTITAAFDAIPTFTITKGATANGSFNVSAGAAAPADAAITVTTVPAAGFKVESVMFAYGSVVKDAAKTAENTYTFTMPSANCAVIVSFISVDVSNNELLELCAFSVRNDGATNGLRFLSRIYDAGDDGKVTIDSKEYTITGYGHLMATEANLAKLQADMIMENIPSDGSLLKTLRSTIKYAENKDDEGREIYYSVVISGITSAQTGINIFVRPYLELNDGNGTSYYYGNVESMSIDRAPTP